MSDGQQLAYVAGMAGCAGVTLLTVTATLLSRRSLKRRLSTLALRLAESPGDVRGGRMETLFGQVERLAERAVESGGAAREESTRLRAALDAVPVAVAVADDSGEVVFRNAEAGRMAGGRHTDVLIGRALEDMFDTPGSERVLELLGPPARTVSLRSRLVDDGRRMVGMVVTADDVTERRRWDDTRRTFLTGLVERLDAPAAAIRLLSRMAAEPGEEAGSLEAVSRLAGCVESEWARVSEEIGEMARRAEAEVVPPGDVLEVLVAWDGPDESIQVVGAVPDPGQCGPSLGVAVARRVAGAHGASVTVEPVDGTEPEDQAGGCRFVLRVPTGSVRREEIGWRTGSSS